MAKTVILSMRPLITAGQAQGCPGTIFLINMNNTTPIAFCQQKSLKNNKERGAEMAPR